MKMNNLYKTIRTTVNSYTHLSDTQREFIMIALHQSHNISHIARLVE